MTLNIDFSKYQALIFDMDGTLVDSMPSHIRAWELALEAQGLPVHLDFVAERGGMPTAKIAAHYQENFKVSIDIDRLVSDKRANFDQLWMKIVPIQATAELMKAHHGQRKLALGTGADRSNMQRILGNLELDQYFDAFVSADEVQAHKPEPDTFLKCAELVGVAPEHCLVFEDTPFGLQAAHNAGMDCVMVLDGGPAKYLPTQQA